MVLNKQEIMEKIEEYLDSKSGEKAGGSGHLSNVSISQITIDEVKKTGKMVEVTFSYNVGIISEFSIAEEPDPENEPDKYDLYHYRKTETITLERGSSADI